MVFFWIAEGRGGGGIKQAGKMKNTESRASLILVFSEGGWGWQWKRLSRQEVDGVDYSISESNVPFFGVERES